MMRPKRLRDNKPYVDMVNQKPNITSVAGPSTNATVLEAKPTSRALSKATTASRITPGQDSDGQRKPNIRLVGNASSNTSYRDQKPSTTAIAESVSTSEPRKLLESDNSDIENTFHDDVAVIRREIQKHEASVDTLQWGII